MSNKIFCVTADKIGFTGRISFKWMVEVPKERLPELTGFPWGYLQKPREHGPERSLNLWSNGRLELACGFAEVEGPRDADYNKEMMAELPPCSILMTTENFEWWERNALKPFEANYERLHIDHPVFTD